jgi:hypothetical protein
MDAFKILSSTPRANIIWITCMEKPRTLKEVSKIWNYKLSALYKGKLAEKMIKAGIIQLERAEGKNKYYYTRTEWIPQIFYNDLRNFSSVFGVSDQEIKYRLKKLKQKENEIIEFYDSDIARKCVFSLDLIKLFFYQKEFRSIIRGSLGLNVSAFLVYPVWEFLSKLSSQHYGERAVAFVGKPIGWKEDSKKQIIHEKLEKIYGKIPDKIPLITDIHEAIIQLEFIFETHRSLEFADIKTVRIFDNRGRREDFVKEVFVHPYVFKIPLVSTYYARYMLAEIRVTFKQLLDAMKYASNKEIFRRNLQIINLKINYLGRMFPEYSLEHQKIKKEEYREIESKLILLRELLRILRKEHFKVEETFGLNI